MNGRSHHAGQVGDFEVDRELHRGIPHAAGCAGRESGSRNGGLCDGRDFVRSPVDRSSRCSPFFFTSRYATPGMDAASLALSDGFRIENAVASAPASAGFEAITVELMTFSAGAPVRGSTMCE